MQNYLQLCKIQSVKEFTQTLKELVKKFGYFPKLQLETACELFFGCSEIIQNTQEDIVKYNALRLAKFAITNDDFMKKYHHAIWTLYKTTLFEQNGNLRTAGVNLLDRFGFGMLCIADRGLIKLQHKKITEKELLQFEKFFVECFMELQELEETYVKNNLDKLKKEEIGDGKVIPSSFETKDKILKNMRKGVEKFRIGESFNEALKRHGYEPRKQSAWEDPSEPFYFNDCVICDRVKRIKENCSEIDAMEIIEAIRKEHEGP